MLFSNRLLLKNVFLAPVLSTQDTNTYIAFLFLLYNSFRSSHIDILGSPAFAACLNEGIKLHYVIKTQGTNAIASSSSYGLFFLPTWLVAVKKFAVWVSVLVTDVHATYSDKPVGTGWCGRARPILMHDFQSAMLRCGADTEARKAICRASEETLPVSAVRRGSLRGPVLGLRAGQTR